MSGTTGAGDATPNHATPEDVSLNAARGSDAKRSGPASRDGEDKGGKGSEPGGAALRVIAGFKMLEALLLIVVGFGVLGLMDRGVEHELVGWLDELSLREGRRLTSELASKAAHLLGTTSPRRFVLIAIGCFGYAAVFVAESVGLWLKKRWAEWLTIVVTASLLPFEGMELMHKASVGKVLTLAVNLVVLGYLIWNVVRKGKGQGAMSS